MTTLSPLEDLLGERRSISVLRVLANVGGGLSGNEIARRVGAQQSAARKALERLVARGIVTRRNIGRTAAYELDERREVVRHVIRPLFRAEKELEQRLWAAIVELVSALRPSPAAVILYGSVARAASEPQDIDLLFVVSSRSAEEALRNQLAELSGAIEEHYRLSIDALFLTETELRSRGHETFVHTLIREGILLHGNPVGPLRRVRRWRPEPSRAA